MSTQPQGGRSVSLPLASAKALQSYRTELRDVPRYPETFTYAEGVIDMSILKRLKRADLIDVVDRTKLQRTESHQEYEVHVYRLTQPASQYLDHLDQTTSDGLPCCNATAFENERGVDGLTCKGCGTVHPPHVIDTHLTGGDGR